MNLRFYMRVDHIQIFRSPTSLMIRVAPSGPLQGSPRGGSRGTICRRAQPYTHMYICNILISNMTQTYNFKVPLSLYISVYMPLSPSIYSVYLCLSVCLTWMTMSTFRLSVGLYIKLVKQIS